MAFSDYLNGPKHKADAVRLETELRALQLQHATELQAHQAKYNELEVKARQHGLLDLLATQDQILKEQVRLDAVQTQFAAMQGALDSARAELHKVQQQILGAEDTVLLESFGLYTPKYRLTNSIDYKTRLDEIREDQKRTARGLSAEVDKWDHPAVTLTKAQWKKLRKDALKLALRSFNSESEYCIENVKFSNLEKMEERIRRSELAPEVRP